MLPAVPSSCTAPAGSTRRTPHSPAAASRSPPSSPSTASASSSSPTTSTRRAAISRSSAASSRRPFVGGPAPAAGDRRQGLRRRHPRARPQRGGHRARRPQRLRVLDAARDPQGHTAGLTPLIETLPAGRALLVRVRRQQPDARPHPRQQLADERYVRVRLGPRRTPSSPTRHRTTTRRSLGSRSRRRPNDPRDPGLWRLRVPGHLDRRGHRHRRLQRSTGQLAASSSRRGRRADADPATSEGIFIFSTAVRSASASATWSASPGQPASPSG